MTGKVLTGCAAAAVMLCLVGLFAIDGRPRVQLEQALRTLLTAPSLPDRADGTGSDPRRAAIYVLGGTQETLKFKFKTASALYHEGRARKVLFLEQPGITEYDPVLRRNLTNREWATKALLSLGIERSAIEAVTISSPGPFGTLAEARSVAGKAGREGYVRIILVTSPLHSRRTWLTFSTVFAHSPSALSLYPTGESAGVKELVVEVCKLVLYALIILPVCVH